MPMDLPEALPPVSDLYGRLLEEFADQIGEKGTSYGQPSRSVREEIVRCVWFGGHFSGEGLTTDDGRRLEVISPGWWNVEGGPDFIRAELLLEGAGRVIGDVEVHTLASSWYSHGHDQQADYNGVVLHVVMWDDRREPAVQTQDGTRVPQLTLSRAVDEDLEELVEIIDAEGEPPEQQWPVTEGKYCGQAYRSGEIDSRWLGRMLDAAGDHRLLSRAAAIRELLENHPREQLLYERLAEALGYKNNRMPFLELAGLLPMATLRRAVDLEAPAEQKSRALEAVLFTVGGFLEGAPGKDADPETMAYCRQLQEDWDAMDPSMAPVRLSPDHWHFAGARPVNYPGRRLAALALLCAAHLHSGLFNHFLLLVNTSRPGGRQRADAALRNVLVGAFTELEHPYWSYRYTLGGKKLSRSRALVGEERATSILVDVLLPMLLAHAQAEDDRVLAGSLQQLWEGMPRRQDNAITRRMEQTTFETRQEAQKVVNSARRQQGLHQLYRDCCRLGGCQSCVLYLAHRAGKSLAVE